MPIIRIIIAVFLIWLALRLYKSFRKKLSDSRSGEAKPAKSGEKMQQCAYCGLHIPQKEAIKAGSHYYCSRDHEHQDQA